jgi:hypothetical protein
LVPNRCNHWYVHHRLDRISLANSSPIFSATWSNDSGNVAGERNPTPSAKSTYKPEFLALAQDANLLPSSFAVCSSGKSLNRLRPYSAT